MTSDYRDYDEKSDGRRNDRRYVVFRRPARPASALPLTLFPIRKRPRSLCARRVIFVVSSLLIAICIATLVGLFFTLFRINPTNSMSVISVVPPFLAYLALSVLLWTLAVSVAGLIAVRRGHPCVMFTFAISGSLLVVFQIVVVVLVLVRVLNPQGSVDYADGATVFEIKLFAWAKENPGSWQDAQNAWECCTYTFESTYDDRYSNIVGYNHTDFATGDRCDSIGMNRIAALHSSHPVFTPQAQRAAEVDGYVGALNEFFCWDRFMSIAYSYRYLTTALFSIFLFLEFSAVVSAYRLLCCVAYDDGGYVVTADQVFSRNPDEFYQDEEDMRRQYD